MEEKKEKIRVFAASNIRMLVSEINRLDLSKDDIIAILNDANQYFIIYTK